MRGMDSEWAPLDQTMSEKLSIRQLKDILDAAGVSYVGLTEKSEFVKKVVDVRARAGSASSRQSPRSQQERPRSSPPPRQHQPPPSSSRPSGPPPTDPTGREIHRILSTDDFYDILNCSKTATDEELKKSYRKLAMKLHVSIFLNLSSTTPPARDSHSLMFPFWQPDKCKQKGGDEAFKKVGNAFSCLSDSQQRAVMIPLTNIVHCES